MWHDLNPKRWPEHSSILKHQTIRRVLAGSKEDETPPGQLSGEYYSDDPQNTNELPQLVLIRDVDSSQYTALVDSLTRSEAIVIEGPPGTGKSQTITNLIATVLEQGKTVLFVAEKMAALNVVYKRLEEAGLGNFCLELHGLKQSKTELLNSVMSRINMPKVSAKGIEKKQRDLNQTKRELIELSKVLTQPVGPEQILLHQLFWRSEVLRQGLPDKFQPLKISNFETVELDQFNKIQNLLDDLGKEWDAISSETKQAWSGFYPTKLEEKSTLTIESQISSVREAIQRISEWLMNHNPSESKPIQFETQQILKLSKLDPEQTCPPFPPEADLSLVHNIVHLGLIHEFKNLLSLELNWFAF